MHFHRSTFESHEHHLLYDYLTGRIDSLGTATDRFAEPVEDKFMQTRRPSDVETLLWTAWRAVIITARSLPYSDDEKREKIVQFVMAVKQRPKLESQGLVCRLWDEQTVWSDLPVFGAAMREAWDVGTATDSDSADKRAEWLNINAFTAGLVAAVQATNKTAPDFSLYGIWTIRTALEEKLDKLDNTAVKAAALWFVNAAPALFAFSAKNKAFDGKIAQAGSSFKGGFDGFSKDRWQTWSRRLQEIEAQDTLDDEARGLVERARKTVVDVEKA